jgi:ABC-type uncharacterized transport system ATPase subunit
VTTTGTTTWNQYGQVLEQDGGHVILRVPHEKAAEITARILNEQNVEDLTVEALPIEDVIDKVFSQNSVVGDSV